MRRTQTFILLAFCLLGAASPASATVTGEGTEHSVSLVSDGADDLVTLTCEGGMAPGGFAAKIPCADVESVFVEGNGGADTLNFTSVGKTQFPALRLVSIAGGDGDDNIDGSQVGDTIEADHEDSVVDGGPGNDSIEAGLLVFGGAGDDLFQFSGGGVNGGSGDDRFENAGAGPFAAGPGLDTYSIDLPAENSRDLEFEIGDGSLGVVTPTESGAFFWSSMDRVELALLDGGTQTVDASKFSGAVWVDGRGGPDVLIGSLGEDFLDGGPGDDEITGGPGFDWVLGDSGADQLRLRDGGVDRGVCGDDADSASADLSDSLLGCESIDLPPVPPSTPTAAASFDPSASPPATPYTNGLKGPRKVAQGKPATFRFESSPPGATFKCKVDKGPYRACESPYKVRTGKLAPSRKHTLSVVAINSAGIPDPTPATLRFSVEEKPETR